MNFNWRQKKEDSKKNKQISYNSEVKAIGNRMKRTKWRKILFVTYKDSNCNRKER